MLKNTWNVTPPGWIHSRLGEIWIYNEGIRSQRSWKVVASLPLLVPLRRLGGGGQSARSSLNVIGWRHAVEYGSLKLASLLFCYFANPWFSLGNNKCFWKENEKLHCENYWQCFRKKWQRWVISFKWPKSEEKINFGGRWVWLAESSPTQNFAVTAWPWPHLCRPAAAASVYVRVYIYRHNVSSLGMPDSKPTAISAVCKISSYTGWAKKSVTLFSANFSALVKYTKMKLWQLINNVLTNYMTSFN